MQVEDRYFLHPEFPENLQYWSRKWGVTAAELHEAILTLGTLHAATLKDHLKRDSWLYHPMSKSATLIRHAMSTVF